MVVIPSLPIIPDAFNSALSNYSGPIVFGPNSGSTSEDCSYALGLNPSNERYVSFFQCASPELKQHLAMLKAACPMPALVLISRAGRSGSDFRKGKPAACSKDGAHYLAFNPPPDFLVSYLGDVAADANIKALTGKPASKDGDLGPTIRLAKRGNLIWVFNYGLESIERPKVEGAKLLIGDRDVIHPADLAVYKL